MNIEEMRVQALNSASLLGNQTTAEGLVADAQKIFEWMTNGSPKPSIATRGVVATDALGHGKAGFVG